MALRGTAAYKAADGGGTQKTIQPVSQGLSMSAPAATSGLLTAAQLGPSAAQFLASVRADPNQHRGSVALGALSKLSGYGGDVLSPEYRAKVDDLQQRAAQGEFYANEGGTNYAPDLGAPTYNQAFLDSLNGFSFGPTSDVERRGYNITSPDGRSQVINWATADSSFDKFADTAVPLGIGLLAAGALGGFIPGAEIGAAGSAGGAAGTAGSAIGAGEGAAQLAAWSAANPLTAAQVTAATLPSAGLPGISVGAAGGFGGGLLANEAASQLAAYSAANPLTAAQVTASTLPAGGLPGLSGGLLAGVPAEVAASLDAYTAANPLTASQVTASTLPAGGLPGLASAAPAVPAFNAAADSQLASSQLGITGNQAAALAKAPATVNLGSLGGTMGTAGGLSGTLAEIKQAVSGGLLGDAATFMKNNPLVGRLITSGLTSALASSGGGGGSSGPAGAATKPNPVQWQSGLQRGLLSNVQQYAPPAVQQNRPAGLLAQGQANDGAWRYLKG